MFFSVRKLWLCAIDNEGSASRKAIRIMAVFIFVFSLVGARSVFPLPRIIAGTFGLMMVFHVLEIFKSFDVHLAADA